MSWLALAVRLSGLVIGDPHQPRRMALDQVDRTAKLDAAVEIDRAGHRLRIGLTSLGPMLQTKRQLEMPGHVPGFVFARPPQPFAKVGADCGDAILPNAVDGGGKIVPIAGGDLRDHRVEPLLRLLEVGWPHRKKVRLPGDERTSSN